VAQVFTGQILFFVSKLIVLKVLKKLTSTSLNLKKALIGLILSSAALNF